MTKARLLHSAVAAKVDGLDDPSKFAIKEALSYKVEGSEFAGNGSWDGFCDLFDWKTGKFPAGFVPTVINVLKQKGVDFDYHRKPLPKALGPMPTPEEPLVDDFPADLDRDYQFKTVRVLEKHGSMIARIATGGGKSRVAALCIKRIGRKTMFITTRQVLLYQMGKALKKAGFKCSYIGDSQWDTSGDVVLAMVQTLQQRIADFEPDYYKQTKQEIQAAYDEHLDRKNEALDFLASIEFVIGEEAHESSGGGYYTVLQKCKNAHYRLALTATPLMRDAESNMKLIGSFGPIRIDVSEKQLIDCGILATPIFKYIDCKMPDRLRRGTAWQKAEDVGVIRNHLRNKHICAEIIRAARFGLPGLILISKRAHGKVLHQMLQDAGLRGAFIFGESKAEKRQMALDMLASGDYDYVIGSTILDVGVDVPAVGILVLAGGGKAEVAIRQRIGRCLRKKKFGPNVALVVDFVDRVNKHLIAHAKQRRAIVDQTPGFAEGVLKHGEDFDYAKIGFKRRVR